MHDRKHTLNPGDPPRHPALQHDRRHDLNARIGTDDPEDHAGERKVSLSAKSLAARGDAPDASEDGARGDAPDASEDGARDGAGEKDDGEA
jgi:hypothetical protein